MHRLIPYLLAVLILPCVDAAETQAPQPMPDKLVVLTFDDSVKSQRELVGPLLRDLGFGATFFISARWMDDTANFMTWQEIAELHAMGFEIGNHSWSHLDFGSPENAARLAGQLALVENELERVGVPRPVSFAWCGNSFGPEALAVLQERGYQFARRGMQPEVPYGRVAPGPLYDPQRHHPLLLPSAGDAYPNWTLDDFRHVVDRAGGGQPAIVQFHGVPDTAHPWVSTRPSLFRECMDYLKQNGFTVIALRDLARYMDRAAKVDDAMAAVHYGPHTIQLPAELTATRAYADYWLTNMLAWHRFSASEAAGVLGWPASRVEAALTAQVPALPPGRIAPYPGGRHPRVGFLDGAIDPLRGTKASVFSTWDDGGYAVVDLPEAIFAGSDLLFLAHTHVPTVWDKQHVAIDNRDWMRRDGGALANVWELPNGVVIGAEVLPAEHGADLRLWLENGSPETLTQLRTQVCVMLKALPGFEAQSNDNKAFTEHAATATSADGARTVTVEFPDCGRAWGNAQCPCIHADPVFPDCTPGERVEVEGSIVFANL